MEKTHHLILMMITISCLILSAQGLSSYTYTFKNMIASQIKLPAYPLGYLAGNETIDWKIETWVNTVELSSMTVKLLYAVNLTQVGTLLKICPPTINCSGLFLTPSAGEYYLKLQQMSASFNFMSPFYLVVDSYPGNKTFVGNPLARQLLRIGDVLRANNVGKLIYSNQEQKITLSLYPLPANTSSYAFMQILPIDMGTYAYSFMDMANYPSNYVSYQNQIYKASVNVKKGYYLLAVTYTTEAPFLTATWEADSYACPYDPSYTDYYGLCQGCAFSSSQPGLPCKIFNSVTKVCSECLSGYTLDVLSGSCKADTQCPPREYYHFGVCYPVSDKCKDFDPFTGDCFTCVKESMNLTNGVCIPVVCGERQWQNDSGCQQVSGSCASFDPSNGNCLTCRDTTLQLINGSCIPIVIVCPAGQYQLNFACLAIPAECLNFDTTNRKCLNCIQGYYIQDGDCSRISCPPNQVPSRFGLFCVDVSPLCNTFDPLSGACLSCKALNQKVDSSGRCVQATSPLAGCRERQRLGFGVCLNAERDCKAYNLVTGSCEECERGFFIDFTGRCEREAQCGARQWSANGECLGVAENCLRADALGLCVECAGADYRSEGGVCVRFKRCGAAQFLSAGGECADVAAACGAFNPSNGECVTCKSGATPHLGRCCGAGEVFDGSACVGESALAETRSSFKGSECLAVHPALGHCLSCNPGFTPDPVTQKTCVQE